MPEVADATMDPLGEYSEEPAERLELINASVEEALVPPVPVAITEAVVLPIEYGGVLTAVESLGNELVPTVPVGPIVGAVLFPKE